MFSSPTLSFVGRDNLDVINFRRVTLRPGSIPTGAIQARLLSTNADAINFAYCCKGPLIENYDISHQCGNNVRLHANVNFNLIGTAKFASYKLVNTSDD